MTENRRSPPRRGGVALVTGATGFIGSNLVAGLLDAGRTEVWCLVRASEDVDDRLRRAVLESARAAGREKAIEGRVEAVRAIVADVREPGCNIGATDLQRLRALKPGEIWHSAASLRYEDEAREEILTTNVDGVRHAIELARSSCISEFNLIGTAYVAGTRSGPIPEGPYDGTYPVNNWYEESKRRGESLALEAAAGNGLRLRIFRPSIVVGNRSTFDGTSSSGFYGFVSGLAMFSKLLDRHSPDYFANNRLQLFREPGTSLDLVPIDELIREAIMIADDPNEEGLYFHLTNPFAVTLEQARIAVEAAFPRMQGEWVESREQMDEQSRLFDAGIGFYAPYLRNDKQFVRTRDRPHPPESLRITTETLTRMTIAFRERRRLLARQRTEAAAKPIADPAR